jgi:signal transduction histidine kinase
MRARSDSASPPRQPSVRSAAASWLPLYVAARLAATAFAAGLVIWGGMGAGELLLLLYGPLSTALAVGVPSLRRRPVAWAVDAAIVLACILAYGDWRSPFYLLWLTTLALPATAVTPRRGLWLGLAASFAFFVVAVIGGPAWGRLQVSSTETLAIHLTLPLLLVASLAYATDALRRLDAERAERERLAIASERQRIAWELHDSAKQRLHAAHLLVSSLHGRVPRDLARTVGRASVELESAAAEMDTSLAELRSPLEGRPLDRALRARADELAPDGRPRITVRGTAPSLSPLVAAHVYRIASEAMTNALRHADATAIDIEIEAIDGSLRLRVTDDGRGLPEQRRPGASGLFAMESRAATIGGRLELGAPETGRGTTIDLEVPLDHQGATT